MAFLKPLRSYCYDKSINFGVIGLMLVVTLVTPALLATQAQAAPQDDDAAEADSGEEVGEEGQDEEDLSFFGNTSVTATGTLTDTFELATPVIVIDADTIEERQPNSATDLLRTEPGVDVNGVGPNQARPIIRGSRGLRVLFLENGLRMNNARRQTDFGEITGLVDINNVQAMEVVRGPASVLYGTDAIGGVLNLITKVPKFGAGSDFGGGVQLRGSSIDDQFKGRLSLNGHSEKLSYQFGYSYRDTSDYESGTGSFGDITADDPLNVNNTGLTDQSFDAYLGYNLNDNNSLFFRTNIYRADETGFGSVDPEAIGDDGGVTVDITYPFQDFDRYTLGWQAQGLDSALATGGEVQLYYQQNTRELQNNIGIDFGSFFGLPNSGLQIDTLNFTDLKTLGVRGEFTKVVGDRNLLTYGIEYYDDDSFNTDDSVQTQTFYFPFPICGDFEFDPASGAFVCTFVDEDDVANSPNATNTSIGLFVQDEFLATDRFSATAGLRWAKVETTAEATPGWDVTGLDFSDDTVVGALNMIYRATDNLNIVGSVASGFRAPNIIERLFNGLTPEGSGFQILNPDLISEDSVNFDLGFKYQDAHAFFEAFYFNNEINDAVVQHTLSDEEIAELPEDVQEDIENAGVAFVVQQVNADTLTIDGFELAGGYRWDGGMSIGGNYTSISGKSVSANDPTGDTFDDKLNLWARYDRTQGRYFWVEGRVRYQGEKDDELDPDAVIPPVGPTIPSFTILTLSGGVNLYNSTSTTHNLTLVLDNLTDELYSEFSNAGFFRPQPGFNAILSYNLGF